MKSQRFYRISTILMVLTMGTAFAAVESLSNFIDSVTATIPNKLDWGAKTEIRYDDNLFSQPRDRRKDSFIWSNSLFADLHRQIGTAGAYGVRGNIGFDWYDRSSSDKNEFNWDVVPYLTGSYGGGNYLTWSVGLTSTAKREKMSSGDTRYARHYTTSLRLGADYQYHPRWGIMGTAGTTWHHYPQSEFRSYSKNVYELSLAPYYKLSEKMRFGLRMAWDMTRYYNHKTNDNSHRMRYTAFIDWLPDEMVAVYLEGGLEKSYYDGATRGTNDDRRYLPSCMLTIRYLPVQNFGVSYTAKIYTKDSTTNRCLVLSYHNALMLNWEITKKILLSGGAGVTHDDQKEGHADTNEWFARVMGEYKYSDHLKFYAGYDYTYVSYVHVHPNDYNESIVRVGATYSF